METSSAFVIFVIALAFAFEFTNGFHDAANSIATIISTEVLTPLQAVIWAAFFNFSAFFIFQVAVANTIGTGLIKPNFVSAYLIFATLTSAILWNMITWYYGLPSSSSHALIGGLLGGGMASSGMQAVESAGFIKVIGAIILSPVIGILIGIILTFIVTRLTRNNSEAVNYHWFGRLQLISSAFLSMTHGGNDAQKTMGVIAVLLYSSSWLGNTFYVPFWVVISCYFVIALGTLAGGWRVVHTMAYRITHLNRLRGCCAETGAALVISTATEFGIPVSTTHTVTGSIVGVGLAQSFWAVQWQMIQRIMITWVLTIPATAVMAAVIMVLKPY